MKGFLKSKWHSIPVGIVSAVLILCLMAGSAFAAYTFLTATIELTIEEPMVVSFDWPDDGEGWLPVSDPFTFADWGVAGDSRTFEIKVENRANNPIDVTTALTGDTGVVTFTGLPSGSIPAAVGAVLGSWTGSVTATLNADAPPGDYTVCLTFDRG